MVRVHEVVSSNLTAPTILLLKSFRRFHPLNIDNADTLIFRLADIVNRIDVPGLFPLPRKLEVELGSGDGSFLVNYAKFHPEINFLGIERLLGRLRKLDRKSRRAGLKNVRCVRIESSYLVQYLLPLESVTAFHIYFPDPWPKRKHRKNRLVNPAFTEIARKALVPGGIVYLRTDDMDYFQQMLEVFAANPLFVPVETPVELSAVVTDFERNFNLRGIRTNYAAYKRIS